MTETNRRKELRKSIINDLEKSFIEYREKIGRKKFDRKVEEAARLLSKAFVPAPKGTVTVNTTLPTTIDQVMTAPKKVRKPYVRKNVATKAKVSKTDKEEAPKKVKRTYNKKAGTVVNNEVSSPGKAGE